MKKIRYLPFGYTIRNGHTVIDQQEAETVRGIFTVVHSRCIAQGDRGRSDSERRSHTQSGPAYGIRRGFLGYWRTRSTPAMKNLKRSLMRHYLRRSRCSQKRTALESGRYRNVKESGSSATMSAADNCGAPMLRHINSKRADPGKLDVQQRSLRPAGADQRR